MSIQTLNNGDSGSSFRSKLNAMFTELYNSVATFVVSGGALGTPTSGTLTNCTGLPVAGITASTSTALGVGSVELGHATDTTISRVSAGVAAIEGNNILVSGGALGTPASGVATNLTGTASGLTAGAVTTINGKVAASTNVTITGTGTNADPYTFSAAGGGGGLTINTSLVSGATAGQILYSDGTKLQAGGAVAASSIALGGATIGSNALAVTGSVALGTPLGAASGGTGVANNAANTITFSGNYGLTFTLVATSALTLPASGTLLSNAVSANLGKGFTGAVNPLGTPTNGSTVTLDPTTGQCVALTNNVAGFTIAPPSIPSGSYTYMDVIITNGASAGAITTSGFSAAFGTYATTSGKIYMAKIYVDNTTGTPYSTITYSGPR